jgi:hypothetical protein
LDRIYIREVIGMSVQQPAMPAFELGKDDERRRYEAAKRRAENLQGFYIHVIVYLVVNAGLFAINALTRGEGGTWWFHWLLAGWGIGLLIHAATLLRVFSPEWVERKARETVGRTPLSDPQGR